jgi:hypothetical protein
LLSGSGVECEERGGEKCKDGNERTQAGRDHWSVGSPWKTFSRRIDSIGCCRRAVYRGAVRAWASAMARP